MSKRVQRVKERSSKGGRRQQQVLLQVQNKLGQLMQLLQLHATLDILMAIKCRQFALSLPPPTSPSPSPSPSPSRSVAGLVTITMPHYHNVDAFYGCSVAKRKPWGKQQQLNPSVASCQPPAGANAMANVAIADNVVIDVFILHFLPGTLLTDNGQRATGNGHWPRTVNFMTCTSRCVSVMCQFECVCVRASV